MTDLFGEPLIPGLRTTEALVDADEEAALIAAIDGSDLRPFQFGPRQGKRLTRSFGHHYDFGRHRLVEADPIPEWLLPLRERAAAFADVPAEMLLHALLIRYDAEAGIGWHRDRPSFDRVVGISLGSDGELAFRCRRPDGRFERHRLPLPRRGAYLLAGKVRHDWEHGILSHAFLRYSVTFRTLAGPG